MLILDLWGISFHAVIVFGPGKNILFKSVLGHCGPGRDLIAGSYHCFIWSLLSLERDNANRANMCWGAIDLLGKQE